MQPPPDVVAGRPAAPQDFVMAAAAAQVTRPARTAGFLAVNVPRAEPVSLAGEVHSGRERPHGAVFIADETMAGGQFAIGGYAEIACARTARIGSVRAAMDLAHRVDHVGEGITLPDARAPFELAPAVDHLPKHDFK